MIKSAAGQSDSTTRRIMCDRLFEKNSLGKRTVRHTIRLR